jgi:hypothetical protein
MNPNTLGQARLRVAALLVLFAAPASAQMDMASMGMKMAPDPLGISMNRAGSGSTWTPDAVSLPSLHFMRGNWDLMVHGFVFGQYTDQGGPRGESQAGSLNWGMFMATHELAGGRLSFRTMLSLDPWTVTARGYPLLLQTGESYHGVPLVDRQHPHDFWMELGATYERAISKNLGFSLYAAPSGEPALAPVAFMHRQSAMDNPFAPLGHHWEDATHVSFGVLTGGIFGNKWKIEGSAFNGREPDENRWDIEPGALDSYSGRLTVNPTANWSATLGYGYLKDMERLSPGESMHRVVGSLLHGAKLGDAGQVATTLVVGANDHHGDATAMSLLETEAVLDARNTLFGRIEYGRKGAGDLTITTPDPDATFSIGALTAGYIREAVQFRRATIGIGVMGAINRVPPALEATYGSASPKAFTAFVRLRPAFPKSAAAAHHH